MSRARVPAEAPETLPTFVKSPGRGRRAPSLIATGEKYGRLTATEDFSLRARSDGRNRALQRFECACGTSVYVTPHSVRSGNTASCGCLHSETVSQQMTTHGATHDHTSAEYLRYRVALNGKRRARKRGAGSEIVSLADLQMLWEKYEGCCWICEQAIKGTPQWDHVHPLAKGGVHALANLLPACGVCNSRKGSMWPFSDDDRSSLAAEVRALRASQSLCEADAGEEVLP
jgi:5-methylcytosine-specific restriction endonuclease McrA